MKQLTKVLLYNFLLISSISCFSAETDFEVIKKRVVSELMNSRVDDAKIEKLITTIQPNGTWPGINYEDVSREGFENIIHTGNMVSLARAFKSKTSKYYKNKKVKSVVEAALKNWVDNDYIGENWHPNQIGVPGNLVELMLLIGDDLPKELVEKAQPIIGRAHMKASGARPSGDRIKIAGILAKNLLFLGDTKRFDEVIRIIEGEIKFVTWPGMKYGYSFSQTNGGLGTDDPNGRGIQFDNSFHHRVDGVNNTLSYGTGYADAFAEWAAYVAGTKYTFSDEKINQLIDYYLDGICKHLIYGKYPDPGAKNRSISRAGELHAYGSSTPLRLLTATNYRKNELEEIINIRDKDAKATQSFAKFYWQSEHFTFQRPNYFTSVRMYSSRNYNMEFPYNSEGLLNHHRGDGVNHISLTGNECYDIWSVYDFQKIPGTTIMQKPQMPSADEIQKIGITDFVGAAADGKYGAVAFDFKSPHDPLCARKAWFFFDDEYVCLGAGISCRTDLPVVTTLNQCLLRDDVTVFSENKKTVIEKGENEFKNVDWVFQDGIGYVFPKPTTVNIKNNQATGSWWTINKQTDSPKAEVKMDVFKLWLDHGKRPSDASYEYLVVPATSIEKLKQNSSKNMVTILANTPDVQAVLHSGLRMCQAVFYKAGEVQIIKNLKLKCETPGIFILQALAQDGVKITVSDPDRKLGKLLFSISAKIEKVGDNYKSVWNEKEGISEFSIDLPQGNYAGQSVIIDL